jgi:ribosomal protein L11 methyltransferase
LLEYCHPERSAAESKDLYKIVKDKILRFAQNDKIMPFALETQNLHPATLLCLQALQELPEDFTPQTIQDLGCGNGILAIVAAKIWPEADITAVDISPKAVKDAQTAVREQEFQDRVIVHHNDVFVHLKAPFAHSKGGFDLTLCNLLADIVIPAAPDIKKSVNIGGYSILSGILAWRAAEIETIYTGLGFEIVKKYEDSPWVCYTLCHKCETIPKPIVTKA